MKRKLFKSLLAVALICTGSNAWADVTITETYDFGAFITANGAPTLTISGDAIAQTGTSAKVGSVKVIDNLSNNGQTLNLNGRFAVDYAANAGSQIRFMWRSSANAYQHGLAGNWNSKGTADPQGAARFSVLNLKAGDKITFTYAKQSGKAADPYTCREDMISAGDSPVGVDAALSSGTQYTMSADGNLDLYFTNNNFAISKIVIVTTGNETVSSPSIAITGASGKARKVTITAGSSDAGNDVTTYYTTDGSEPTTTSASFTGASQEITIGESATEETDITVKAYSVSTTSAESTVSTQVVSVGTVLQLAAPSITLSTFTAAGQAYNPTYSFASDQSGVIGNPVVTYSYSFAGGAATEGVTYTATASGSITVTVTAEGYTSNSTTQEIVGGVFAKTYSFDAINDVTIDTESGTWANPTSVNGVQWTFTSYENASYSLREDISISGFMYARATTAKTKQGFYTRGGAGSIGFDLEDGEIIVFTLLNGIVDANSEATSQAFAIYTNIRAIDIYTPATEVSLAILDCKRYETSNAFATAVAAESFSTAAEVYAFHTAWQIANASGNDITKVIRNAAVSDAAATDWDGAGTYNSEWYDGAPDHYFIDNNGAQMWATQMIYGLPAGKYQVQVATRANANNYSHVYVSYNGSYDICTARGNHVGNTGGELGNGWSWTYVPFEITETANILLGFYKDATSWAGCDDWHLYKVTEDYPVVVSEAGWATLYAPYALNFEGTGLTAYTATLDNTEKTVELEEVTTIPALTGVVLKGASGSYNVPLAASSSTPKGDLKGSVTWATNFGDEYDYFYLAMNDEGKAQFKKLTSGSIAAGKAYLMANKGALGVKAFNVVFSGTATGINAVESARQDGMMFNLAGQRVSMPARGLYIKNGKKVVVK